MINNIDKKYAGHINLNDDINKHNLMKPYFETEELIKTCLGQIVKGA